MRNSRVMRLHMGATRPFQNERRFDSLFIIIFHLCVFISDHAEPIMTNVQEQRVLLVRPEQRVAGAALYKRITGEDKKITKRFH